MRRRSELISRLGRFLEYSLPTEDIQASFNFYRKLGFTEASVGETWNHPYAVVTDGRIVLGLHQAPEMVPALTFVKPELLAHLGDLERAGVEFEYQHLGDNVFNEVAWDDAAAQRLRLLEARTFSPPKRASTDFSMLGFFSEVVLPAEDLEAAKSYYEAFGFVGMEEFEERLPHVSCTSDHLDIGLYEANLWRGPTLRFEPADLAGTRARLTALGIEASRMLPAALRAAGVVLIVAPEGTQLWLVPD